MLIGEPYGGPPKERYADRFDSRLKLKFLGSQVTSDAGLLANRELDEALGLTAMSAERLQDSRLGLNKQHAGAVQPSSEEATSSTNKISASGQHYG